MGLAAEDICTCGEIRRKKAGGYVKLKAKGAKLHPPIHKGCDCFIVPEAVEARRYGATLAARFISSRDKLPEKFRPFVTPHTISEYSKMGTKLYISKTKKSGYGITKDGDLISVFSLKGAKEGSAAIVSAIERGAETLDCFDGPLVGIYKRFGFTEYKRLPWDAKYAPKGWNSEK